MPIHILIEIPENTGVGMEHQVLPDLTRRIGDTVGKTFRLGIQHDPRCADAVARHDHNLGRLKNFAPPAVVVNRARRHAIGADRNLPHAAQSPQFHPGPDRLWPVRDIRAGLRPLRATGRAMTEVDAFRPPLVILRGDGAVGRPPMVAQFVQPAPEHRTGGAQGQRRHHRLFRRIGRIARQTGNAGVTVVFRVIRLQRFVIDRPIVAHAVQRFHPKIGRVKSRIMPGVQHRPAADAVVIGDFDRRIFFRYRIVQHPPAAVRADIEIAHLARFPVAPGGGELGRFRPIALFQTNDAHLRFREAIRHGGTGCARADNQHIDFIQHGAPSRLLPDPARCWTTPPASATSSTPTRPRPIRFR